jgi:hypothetical protein
MAAQGPSDTDDSHAVIDWLLTRSSSRGVFMTQSQFGRTARPAAGLVYRAIANQRAGESQAVWAQGEHYESPC